MTFTIRDATIDDIPEMFLISLTAHQEGYADMIPAERKADFQARYTDTPENRARYVEHFEKIISDPAWYVWVAVVDDKVVGYTLAHKESEHILHKKGLFMSPGHQGQGIGSALFNISLTPIETGVVDLSVIATNARARHVYEKHGFVPVGPDPKLFFGATQEVMTLTKH